MQRKAAQQELEVVLNEIAQKMISKEWMTLKEGAEYAGVSYNSFKRFQLMGLKIAEVGGIKRVSKKEIDKFLKENSY
ncbi:helix-turn-helix domain-containing protein [Metaplanococcus flavidus]|uniref:DNA-binding protein n=1 Tax=Metaplanococcus flavidus TaxID=569883 RepID=A0ABW3LG58_9BACL